AVHPTSRVTAMIASPALRISLTLLAAALLLVTGCPTPNPPAAKSDNKDKGIDEALVENADDIKALQAAKAELRKDAAGHVDKVELNRDSGNDADLAHLKGLPFVRELGADVRGVTDAGLKSLANHPNLRTLRLEQSSVTDAGMEQLEKLP